MVINTNLSPQSKTRSLLESAPATGQGPAKSDENKRGVPQDTDAGPVLAMRFDGPASGTQAEGRPIEDAGAAEASVQWARNHIVSHPALAMLAHANSNPESALALLQ
jgi:flagellin-like hook-associated protein FlgL